MMSDDIWRKENRHDLCLGLADRNRYDVPEGSTLWFVSHAGMCAFFVETDVVEIVKLNRLSNMRI